MDRKTKSPVADWCVAYRKAHPGADWEAVKEAYRQDVAQRDKELATHRDRMYRDRVG